MSAAQDQDAAWISIEAPFPPRWLLEFVNELERLFRINSLLEIYSWEEVGEGRIQLRAINLSNGSALECELFVTRLENGLDIRYQGQLKRATYIRIEAGKALSGLLRITDDYSAIPTAEREARLDEVDRSLLCWGQDLHRYLMAWHRWSWLPTWRWYMSRVWLGMKPSARRITRWILWITLAELVAFLMVFAVFVIEQGS